MKKVSNYNHEADTIDVACGIDVNSINEKLTENMSELFSKSEGIPKVSEIAEALENVLSTRELAVGLAAKIIQQFEESLSQSPIAQMLKDMEENLE